MSGGLRRRYAENGGPFGEDEKTTGNQRKNELGSMVDRAGKDRAKREGRELSRKSADKFRKGGGVGMPKKGPERI